jgi:phthiodiolone/phenolphthiodiolone dimycocerosates ketoreductase
MARLAVGIEGNCAAPMGLEKLSLRLFATVMRVDSLWVPDHYLSFVPRHVWRPEYTPAAKVVPSPDAYFDPFVMLGMMAQRHKRIRLGTGVTEPLRRHPATLAQAFVTLDHLTGGRAILGIGNGERENTEPYGIPFTKRVARLGEALEIIRRLWSSGGEPVDFDGTFWTLRRALFTTPLHRGRAPALWVAAHAPKMLALTGRWADGWYPTLKMKADEYRAKLDRIRASGAEHGRDLSGFEPGSQIQVVVGRDRKTVLEQLAASKVTGAMAMLMPGAAWKAHGLRHPLGETFEGFPDFVPEEVTPQQIEDAHRQVTPALLGDGISAGNPTEIAEDVQSLVHAGLRHVILWNLTPLLDGGSPAGLLRLTQLVRRLKKIQLPGS